VGAAPVGAGRVGADPALAWLPIPAVRAPPLGMPLGLGLSSVPLGLSGGGGATWSRQAALPATGPIGMPTGSAAPAPMPVEEQTRCYRLVGPHAQFAAGGCAALSGLDLRGANLTGANLDGIDLSEAVLDCATLDGATLHRAAARKASFVGASLTRVAATGALFERADFTHASLAAAQLGGGGVFGSLTDSLFREASLKGATLSSIQDSSGVLFDGADLTGASFERCVLPRLSLRASVLANATFSHSELEGILLSPSTILAGATFAAVDFLGAQLDRICFDHVRLEEVALIEASLVNASFRSATITLTEFDRSLATGADFSGARFSEVDFIRTALAGASFRGANLLHSQLSECNVERTDFTGDLSTCTPPTGTISQHASHVMLYQAHSTCAPSTCSTSPACRSASAPGVGWA